MNRLAQLVMLLAALSASADRGALSVDVGAGGVAAAVPALKAEPPHSTVSFDASFWLGGRYALTNWFELSATGFFEPPAQLFHNDINLVTDSGTYPGTTRHEFWRFGAQGGARLVLGMRFRFHVGVELGWCQQLYVGQQHFDTSNPQAAVDYGLVLPDASVANFVIAPLLGLEWVGGDSWSFAVLPRAQLLLGPSFSWAVILPLQFSWSWYL